MVNDMSSLMEVQVTVHPKSETQKQLMQQWNWTPVVYKLYCFQNNPEASISTSKYKLNTYEVSL